jgi:2-dehydro-3-deoxygalactonokinase
MPQLSDTTPAPANQQRDLHQASPAGVLPAADRMRIAAFLATHPNWDGVICMPGDATHWAQISADEIVSFQSFLSARLANAMDAETGFDQTALSDSLSRPDRIAAHLRSAEVAQQPKAILCHLIGAELAAAKPYWLGQNIALLGASPLADVYAQALAAQGLPVERA